MDFEIPTGVGGPKMTIYIKGEKCFDDHIHTYI